MPVNYALEDMSSQYQGANADADLKMKQAQEMKVMQEVYDLAVNNQYQKIVLAEETSPQGVRVRSQKRDASIATSEAEMWKGWNETAGAKSEQAEAGFAVFNMDPSQETYDLVYKSLTDANPSLVNVLDQKYSPKAAQQVKAVQRSYLNSRAFKQKIAGMGIAGEIQEQFAQAQVGRDSELQHQKANDAIALMESTWNRRDWNTGLQEEAADERATAGLEAGLQIAKRLNDQGNSDLSMAYLAQMKKQEQILAMAKARSSSTGLTQEKDRQTIAVKAYNQTKSLLEDDWGNDKALGITKEFKVFEARGMSNTINSLHAQGEKFTTSDKLPAWTQQRMIVWPEQKRWLELPLDNNGMPLGGMNSEHIRGLIGKEYTTKGAEPTRHTAYVSDLDEAIEIYAQILREDFEGYDLGAQLGPIGVSAPSNQTYGSVN
jgi:hypothetical protein